LRERCRFLEQVHLYHSSVEDEVFPNTSHHLNRINLETRGVLYAVKL
jgi:hypothetical protein